ncbi:ABC transporter ATP-binding protein [Arcobacter arenosus]|jgi:iron complex transport system ATP-binding protein|uniref:ABC transporter ATP-binding protein n=1 Tax=Arcobacter arenosus TaxID=2576037 RepID=A0A5R8XY77_9BACT|nr:ABC transporter ATP-binding protein [Arcobacter arenosus]TLP36290.1 ABC transporter ATP-binding protein [Arcobacter arenosus]
MLEIKNYSSFILNDISFKLEENENLIILGQNGAGKSTLAKVLSNLINNNQVFLDNEDISSIDDLKRAKFINYIPPGLTIFDEYITLKEFLELSFVSTVDNQKVSNIISLLKMEKLKDKFCKSFSSGEKQLVLLASAIIHDAKITIFDELTANLDINRLKDVYDIFKSDLLNQKIIITHNLDLAYALKFKILFLKDGKIEFFGSNEEFFENSNLEKFYNKSIQKVNNHLVVNL